MNCTRVEKFLPLHVAGDLAGRRALAVEGHLMTCGGCRRAAAEHGASLELLRSSSTIPSDFDEAFYEAIRNSVLARISRDQLAPRRFPIFFGARPAHATALALLVITITAAALALHTYTGRTPADGSRQTTIATVSREHSITPAAPTRTAAAKAPQATRPGSDARAPLRASDEIARLGAAGSVRRAAESPAPQSDANIANSRAGSPPGTGRTSRTLPAAARRAPAPAAVLSAARAEEINRVAAGVRETGEEARVAPEFSRIELQTSDPNIRIIWLSPQPQDAARPSR